MTSYGQNGEDLILAAHFGDKADGRFLDVGAWSGACLSNTFALAERGWSGVAVEPSPRPFLGLLEAYAAFPRVELVNAAVAPEPGLHTWFDSGGDAVSTLSAAHAAVWASKVNYRRYALATVTPAALLERYGRDYHLISVDVEGASAELLQTFPIDEMPTLTAIVVEHDGRAAALGRWLAGFGFAEVSRNAENAIYTR